MSVTFLEGKVEQVPCASLRPSPRNSRTHSKPQIKKIAESIQRFGFVTPILVDGNGTIIAGHARFEAADLLRLNTVPVLRVTHLSKDELRAYLIADNRLAELAGWDRDMLRLELTELSIELPELDLTVTGFEIPEIDQLILGDAVEETDAKAEAIPALDDGPAISRFGDLWEVGPHRILCGDAREPKAYERLLGNRRADLLFTDPPYNVKIDGHARGKGTRKHADFSMAAGEMSEIEFIAFLTTTLGHAAAACRPGAMSYVCMDWRHLFEALTAGRKVFDTLVNMAVWVKANAGMGSFYRSQHELVLIWRVRGGAHRNNVQLGRFGRNRTNVWTYAGATSFGQERDLMLEAHPTVKPVALVAGAILDASKANDLVLDPFAGSGSTLVAAQKTGRVGAGIEFDPRYCDLIVRRLQEYVGLEARHAESGLTFAEEAERRRAAPASIRQPNGKAQS